MLAYRNSVQIHVPTGCTPFALVFGSEAWLLVDVMYSLPQCESSPKMYT